MLRDFNLLQIYVLPKWGDNIQHFPDDDWSMLPFLSMLFTDKKTAI